MAHATMPDKLNTRLKDYLAVGDRLFWQRHLTFLGITGLVSFYYDGRTALFFLACFVVLEGLDWIIAKVGKERLSIPAAPQKPLYAAILLSSTLYSSMIASYVLTLSSIEGPGPHVVSLLFLFTAVLFAAVNNHQLPAVLALRLSIYALSGILVATTDLIGSNASLHSPLWLQFFTTLFVIFFLAECARQFLNFYQEKLETIQQLKRDRQFSIQAYQAKTEFLSIVSHELRTPLTSLVGALKLMHRNVSRQVNSMDGDLLDVAKRNSDRLLLLINDLLDFQAIDAGRIRLKRTSNIAESIVLDAIGTVEGMAVSRGITILSHAEEGGLRVYCDHDRLVQVLANVLSNAIKFSVDGSRVEILISSDVDQVRIAITDFGKGIADSSKGKVFEAFSQVDSSDRRLFGGTGLGMAISKMIMEAHDGSIDFFSQIGVGTTFVLTLPRSDAESTVGWQEAAVNVASLSQ